MKYYTSMLILFLTLGGLTGCELKDEEKVVVVEDSTSGEDGKDGVDGAQGPKGDRGATGPRGPMGPQGDKGDKGDKGDSGTAGATGPRGPKGEDGKDGVCNENCCDVCVVTKANNHAMFFASRTGIGTDYKFIQNGTLSRSGETAHLTGTLISRSKPNRMWVLDLLFKGKTSSPPSGSPKLERGPKDTSDWVYYPEFGGTLIGQGDYHGVVLEVNRKGPSFQVGVSANGKNDLHGGSAWFTYEVLSQGLHRNVYDHHGRDGDFNLNLECKENNN